MEKNLEKYIYIFIFIYITASLLYGKLTQQCRSTIHQLKNLEKEILGYFCLFIRSFIRDILSPMACLALPGHWRRPRQQRQQTVSTGNTAFAIPRQICSPESWRRFTNLQTERTPLPPSLAGARQC